MRFTVELKNNGCRYRNRWLKISVNTGRIRNSYLFIFNFYSHSIVDGGFEEMS